MRAGAFALAAVSLSLAAHTIAGGPLPAPLALLTAVVGVGCVAVAATGRRIGGLGIGAGLVAMQGLLHVWFSLTGGHGCDVGGIVLSGHHHGAAACAQGVSAAATASHPATSSSAGGMSGLAMPVAHVLAVLLTSALLARGERALWQLATLARTYLTSGSLVPARATVDAAPAVRRPAPVDVRVTGPADPGRTAIGRRGPPALACG
ncbi:hypothetical protein GCM10023145_34510 [Angustibacter luteus]